MTLALLAKGCGTDDADLLPSRLSFCVTEVQPKASSGGVIKEQSDRLRKPLATLENVFKSGNVGNKIALMATLKQHLTTSSDGFVTV